MTKINPDFMPVKGEKRYWINGHWRKDFNEAVKVSEYKHDIWVVYDGWNPENGCHKTVGWRTIR